MNESADATTSAALSAELVGSTVWGGGLNQWTVYIIQVSRDGDSWQVFRRFSSFEALHAAISRVVDAMTRVYLNKNFPEKEMGSFLGTFNFVVEKRQAILKRYLSLLLMHPVLVTNPILLSFLDAENRGVSGLVRSMGATQVHLESFVHMSLSDFANLVWTRCFLVLTKSGQLFAMEDCYDTPEKAILATDLRLGGRVKASTGGKCEVVARVGEALKTFGLDFEDQGELAIWVRAMSAVMTSDSLEEAAIEDGSGFGYSSSSARSVARQQHQQKRKGDTLGMGTGTGSGTRSPIPRPAQVPAAAAEAAAAPTKATETETISSSSSNMYGF